MRYAYTNKFIRIFASIFDFCGSILFFWIPKNKNINPDDIKKILIVKLDQLGDCFLMTPIFEYLKNKFPKSQIDLICQENAKPIFENNPFISNILTFNYWRMHRGKNPEKLDSFLKLIKKLKKEKYNLFIDSRGEPLVALLGFKIGAKYRVGFEKEEICGFLYTHLLRYDKNKHETEKYKIILNSLGIQANEWLPKIYIKDEEKKRVDDLVKNEFTKSIIAIGAGAGADYKKWPIENFKNLISLINQKYDCEFAVLGSKGEKDSFRTLGEIKNVKNLVGDLTIRETYYFLSKTKIFIGNDSALGHFSGALDIPTIILMNGVINENRWRPIGKKVKIIKGIDGGHKYEYDKDIYPCPNMKAIKADEVVKIVFGFLNNERL